VNIWICYKHAIWFAVKFCRSALRVQLTIDWNNEWVTSTSIAPLTRLFVPTVAHSVVLASRRLTAATVQILSGHLVLNGYLAKIGKRASTLCNCKIEDETVPHFLFHCSRHHASRAAFKRQCLSLNSTWPPELSLIPQNKALWDEMINFMTASQRFNAQTRTNLYLTITFRPDSRTKSYP